MQSLPELSIDGIQCTNSQLVGFDTLNCDISINFNIFRIKAIFQSFFQQTVL